MTFDVEVAGRTRTVEVASADGVYRVVVDGRPRTVDAVRAGATWSLLVGVRSREVSVGDDGDGGLAVYVDGRRLAVRVTAAGGARRRAARRRSGGEHAASAAGPMSVGAPMPGRVVAVLVAVGESVAARQGLVIVEAMKMENELRAPRAGRVADVRVMQGALVDAKAVLVVIE
ncbi:MAG: biotin/lipoyl-binding protein [Acidobacteria bacterium]|nr:biotin/lipoyl-binding protein [Acidobacteriota bacterium]